MTQKPLYKRGDRVLIVDTPTSIFHPRTVLGDGMHRFLNKWVTIKSVKKSADTGRFFYYLKEDR
jgi:hypothetical protein